MPYSFTRAPVPSLRSGTRPSGLEGSNCRTRSGATAGMTLGVAGFGGAAGACAACGSSMGTAFGGGGVAIKSSALTTPFRARASTSNWNSASGAALRMAFASAGARTPFMTSTPSNAVTFALPAVTATFGAAPDAGADTFTVLSGVTFRSLASLAPASAGAKVPARSSRVPINGFHFIVNISS